MTHEHARALLPSYAAGALDLPTAAALRQHLVAGCTDCLRDLFRRPLRPELPTSIAPSPRDTIAPVGEPPRRANPPVGAAHAVPVTQRGHAVDRPRARARSLAAPLRPQAITAIFLVAVAALYGTLAMRRIDSRAPIVGERSARLAAVETLDSDRVTVPPQHRTRPNDDTRAPVDSRVRNDAVPGGPSGRDEPSRTAGSGDHARAPRSNVRPSDATDRMIRYADDTLSLHVVNMPLGEVLQAIGREAGVAVRGGSVEARPVNVGFENVPFVQALRRLLGVRNFVLTYDGGHPRRLDVLDTAGAPTEGTRTAGTVPEGAASAAQSIAALLDSRPPVPLSTSLVQALGRRATSLRQLLDLAVNHVDKAVRGIAMSAAVEALQADPELRAAMFGARPGMRDGIFGALVQGMERERAQEALFNVAIRARDSELRNGAAALILRIGTSGTSRADS